MLALLFGAPRFEERRDGALPLFLALDAGLTLTVSLLLTRASVFFAVPPVFFWPAWVLVLSAAAPLAALTLEAVLAFEEVVFLARTALAFFGATLAVRNGLKVALLEKQFEGVRQTAEDQQQLLRDIRRLLLNIEANTRPASPAEDPAPAS